MMESSSFFRLTVEQVARLLGYLPCAGPCGRPGPHPTYRSADGSRFALCGACREAGQGVGNEVADRLEVSRHG